MTATAVYKEGDQVNVRTLNCGTLKGVILENRDERTVLVRLTSRMNRFYKCGEVLEWPKTRIVRR